MLSTYLAGFILRDLMLSVLFALFALAVGAAGFGNLEYDQFRQYGRRTL